MFNLFRIIGEEMIVIDPNTLLGKQYDLIIDIKYCHDVSWVKENSTRGFMLRLVSLLLVLSLMILF